MKYLLGIDFGGGSSKATLLSHEGRIVAENTVEYPTLYPESGACEQSPADWVAALCINTRELLQQSGVDAGDITAVALDSATHTYVMLDGEGRPVYNAIHWTDTRCRAQATQLREVYGEEIFAKTYHKPDTIWTLPSLLWFGQTHADVFAKVKHILFEKDYLRYFLTDVLCTDHIEAQGSMLYDCNRRVWDEQLCALAGISTELLPPLVKPTDVVGTITPSAAEQTGLVSGTPVICGTTDTVMEVFASGAVSCGDMTVKLATAGRICVITDQAYPDRQLINYSHIVDGLWYPGTATKAAAASSRWYRDTFGGNYRGFNEEAADVPLGCDGLRFHPYLNGELTPYADPMLCGSFTGIRATHTKAHFTRAVFEGVALSMLDCKRYLDGKNIPYQKVATAIGGGVKGKLWRQILSDVLGLTLRITESSDSSLGSAMLAGVATGVFADAKAAVDACIEQVDLVEPNLENTARYAEIFEEYKKIHDALAPIYDGR